MLRPRVLLAGYAVAVVTNASTVVGPLGPLSIQVLLIGLLLAAVLVGWLRGRLRPRWSVVYLLLVVYAAVRLLSLVSALDTAVSTAALVEELKQDYTIAIVTHNMQQAARVSDYTAFMYLGDLIEHDATSIIFSRPSKQQTEDYITGRFG